MKSKKAARQAMSSPPRPKRLESTKKGEFSIPKLLFAEASPHSISKVSMFDVDEPIRPDIVGHFASDQDLVSRSITALQDAGFQVLQASNYLINIAAPIATYERALKTKILPKELPTLKSGGVKDTATYFTTDETPRFGLIETKGTPFENLLEGVAIETPRYPFHSFPPKRAYWHLQVPADVSLACNADKAHRAGITGRGIKVAMVDSGHFAHPFFAARGYRVQAVTLGPGAANPLADENGHGTAESANIFAVAPDVELHPVKMNFTNSLGAFNAAVDLSPDIISCSWGSSVENGPLSAADQALGVAVADAVARGIIVVFAAGNGHWGFPGQHPDVISAGGVFMDGAGALQASNYASGFASKVYPGRNVPDLCGLVGMRPKAAYIMLPLQQQCDIDVGLAGGAHPNGDETANNDGWAAISGTSAACPQLAGAAALVKEACKRLTPAQVRDILVRTAIDVTAGSSQQGNAAAAGADLATGAGLVDAHAAVLVAKVRCLAIRPPVNPGPIRTPPVPPQPPQPPSPRPPGPPTILPRPPGPPTINPRPPVPPIGPPRPPIAAPGAAPQFGSQDTGESDSTGSPASPMLSDDDAKALEELVIKGKFDPTK